MKLVNAFSFNMVTDNEGNVRFCELNKNQAKELLMKGGFESAVGHADTAKVFSNVLDMDIPCERVNVFLKKGDACVLGQYKGPRLQEGATRLPEGARIVWYHIIME